jgi:hypothetical protein
MLSRSNRPVGAGRDEKIMPFFFQQLKACKFAIEAIFKCCLKFGTAEERIARKIRPIPHYFLRDLRAGAPTECDRRRTG